MCKIRWFITPFSNEKAPFYCKISISDSMLCVNSNFIWLYLNLTNDNCNRIFFVVFNFFEKGATTILFYSTIWAPKKFRVTFFLSIGQLSGCPVILLRAWICIFIWKSTLYSILRGIIGHTILTIPCYSLAMHFVHSDFFIIWSQKVGCQCSNL